MPTTPSPRATDLSLRDAIADLLEAQRYCLRPSTHATYRSHLGAFSAAHPTARVRDLVPPLVRRHLDPLLRDGKRYAARNRAVALRALARHLSTELGIPARGRSVLAGLRLPAVPYGGRAPYRTDEILRMWEVIRAAPRRCRTLWAAVFWLLLGTGLRSGEARGLQREDVEFADLPRGVGHVVVSAENAKSIASARLVPLDPRAERALRAYLADRRRSLDSREPLFVSADGRAFTRDGWNAMHQRIRRAVRDRAGLVYQAHRLRNTWARDMLEAGVPETVIVQLAGWADGEMLRRYVGRLSARELKGYPTTLAKYVPRSVRSFGRVPMGAFGVR